jgi:hypothetical protein
MRDSEADDKFYALVGRALVDPEFRKSLVDPDTRRDVLTKAGIDLSDEELAALGRAYPEVQKLAQQFDIPEVAAA